MSEQSSIGVYPPSLKTYISLVENEELNFILEKQIREASEFFNSIQEDRWSYKYAENKWTIKEVLQHIIDTERIFGFRALVFARKDPNTIRPFDENEYAKNSGGDNRNPKDLIEEFLAVRKSSLLLFQSFSHEQLQTIGKSGNNEMSVNAVGYMLAGHFLHHLNILKERYL